MDLINSILPSKKITIKRDGQEVAIDIKKIGESHNGLIVFGQVKNDTWVFDKELRLIPYKEYRSKTEGKRSSLAECKNCLQLSKENLSHLEALDSKDRHIAKLKGDLSNTLSKVLNLERICEELQNRNIELEKKGSSLTDSNNDLRTNQKNFKGRIVELEKENLFLKSQYEKLYSDACAEIHRTKQLLNEKDLEMEMQVNQFKELVDKKHKEAEKIRQENNTLLQKVFELKGGDKSNLNGSFPLPYELVSAYKRFRKQDFINFLLDNEKMQLLNDQEAAIFSCGLLQLCDHFVINYINTIKKGISKQLPFIATGKPIPPFLESFMNEYILHFHQEIFSESTLVDDIIQHLKLLGYDDKNHITMFFTQRDVRVSKSQWEGMMSNESFMNEIESIVRNLSFILYRIHLLPGNTYEHTLSVPNTKFLPDQHDWFFDSMVPKQQSNISIRYVALPALIDHNGSIEIKHSVLP